MAAYYRSVRKGLLEAIILLLVNAGISGLAVYVELSSTIRGVFGDLLLLEVGALTILGGMIEFSRSKGVYEFRRLALTSKETFSTAKHGEASKNAVEFFTAALVLLSALIVLALSE